MVALRVAAAVSGGAAEGGIGRACALSQGESWGWLASGLGAAHSESVEQEQEDAGAAAGQNARNW